MSCIWTMVKFDCLTLYHMIMKKKKNSGKRRKWCLPLFSPFPTMFSTLLKTDIIILGTFYLSSANALNLVKSKKLLFGKELMKSYPL